MLNFLRNIRRTLLAQNQVSRYLLYAFGEILLVMIGILLALQVNKWSNNRIDRAYERDYLHRLLVDLEQDSVVIARNQWFKREKIANLMKIDSLIHNRKIINSDSIVLTGFGTNLGWAIHESRSLATYDELISSGHLRLIQNVDLRKNISIYYSWWDNDIFRALERRSGYPNLIYQLYDDTWDDDTPEQIDIKRFLEQITNTNSENEFERALRHEINYGNYLSIIFEDLEERRSRFQEEIKEELRKLEK